jgi:alpha-tubulin suppressor-like RCC1 family protein
MALGHPGDLIAKAVAPTKVYGQPNDSADPFLRNVVQVQMGDSHSLFLDTEGNVYSSGTYQYVRKDWRRRCFLCHRCFSCISNSISIFDL